MFGILFLLMLGKADEGLPFEDEGAQHESPKEVKKENPIIPTRKLSLQEMIGKTEVLVFLIFLLYATFLIGGAVSIIDLKGKFNRRILQPMAKFFSSVPESLQSKSWNEYFCFVTGRTSYIGCLISLKLTKRLDPIGYLFDKFKKQKNKLSFEFALKQKGQFSGMLHISKEKPSFADALQLKQIGGVTGDYMAFSDMEEAADPMVELVNNYITSHPGLVDSVEMSDANHFELGKQSRYALRLEFIVSDFFDESMVEFCCSLADNFATTSLPQRIVTRNEGVRAHMRQTASEGGILE